MSLYTRDTEQKTEQLVVSLRPGKRGFRRRPAFFSCYFVGVLVSLIFSGNAFCGTTWVPPIGIPSPTWPSNLNIARPTLPSSWTSDQAGFYFIASSGCSDTRAYGNPSAARCSIPTSPAAGSVIVLNGTISGDKSISFSGTSGSPVWIMGYSTTSKPLLTGVWSITGSYKILDNLAFSNAAQDGNLAMGGSYNMVRASTFVDTYYTSNGDCVGGGGSNNVIYGITISQCGNWTYTSGGDIDRHGIKVLWERSMDSRLKHLSLPG